MTLSTRIRRSSGLAVVAALLGACIAVATAAPASAAGLGAGGEYHPLTPQRIYDSRPAELTGGTSPINEPAPGPKPVNPSRPFFDIDVLGQGGVPEDGVLAVVVNITVVNPTGQGWLNAYAADVTPGPSSIVNFAPGVTVPNLAIVSLSATGALRLQTYSTANASAHIVVDVFGFFSQTGYADRGARLQVESPGRLFDTRQGGGAPMAAGAVRSQQVQGATLGNGITIPSNVTGVMLNVTGVNDLPGSQRTFVAVVPDLPTGKPGTSNLNLPVGARKANSVIVPVGADGKVHFYNHVGTTHVVVDVVGWFFEAPDETLQGRVVPLGTPFRLWDTRQAAFGAMRLGAGQAEDWGMGAFANSVTINGQSGIKQSAVIGNLTAASLTRQYPTVPVRSYMTVWDPPTERPTASVLNLPEGSVAVPNLAVLPYSDLMTVRFYNFAGQVHYLFDASAVVLDD